MDLQREFHDWDFQLTFSLPPFLLMVVLISLSQVVIIYGALSDPCQIGQAKIRLFSLLPLANNTFKNESRILETHFCNNLH